MGFHTSLPPSLRGILHEINKLFKKFEYSSVHLWVQKCIQWSQSWRNGTCIAGTCTLLPQLVGRLAAGLFSCIYWDFFEGMVLFFFLWGGVGEGLFLRDFGLGFFFWGKSARVILCPWSPSLPVLKQGFVNWGKRNCAAIPKGMRVLQQSPDRSTYSLTALNQRC